MEMSYMFLMITIFVAIPLAIIALVFGAKTKGGVGKFFAIAFPVIVLGLSVAACITSIIGMESYVCGWVALGLSVGAVVLGLFSLAIVYAVRDYQKEYSELSPNKSIESKDFNEDIKVDKSQRNTNYIDEIKQLKELLDCGALTQEEFDKKKKEILNNSHI